MSPFNIESAKSGAEVCTKCGIPVTIFEFDAPAPYPISAELNFGFGRQNLSFTKEGRYITKAYREAMEWDYDGGFDLMMVN